MVDLESEEELQIELEVNGVTWSSERFNANDLKKIALAHPKMQLNLTNKGDFSFLSIAVVFHNS